MSDPEKAFGSYRQVLDEKIDETRLAFAAICLMRDRPAEARTLVEEALTKQQVKSPSLLQFRALLAAIDDRSAEAFDYLAQSIEGGGEGSGNLFFGGEGPGLEILVGFACRTNQLDRFVEVCRKRLKKDPNKWEEHRLLAETLYQAGRWREAFKVLDRAGKVKAIKRNALTQRIEWMEGFSSPDKLIKNYETLIKLSERKVKPSSSRLQQYFSGSRGEERIETQPLRDRLGDLLWQKGKRDRAEQTWTERMDQKAVGTHLSLGRRFLEKEVYDRARECFRRAVEIEPTNMEANRALATLAFQDRDFEALIKHLREVFLEHYLPKLPDAQDDASSQYAYTNEYARQRDKSGGQEADLRRWALALSQQPEIAQRCREGQTPEDAELRLILTILTGDWTAAETELRGRLDSSPCDPMIWTLWALAQERKGEWGEAIRAWEQVRRLKLTTIADHRDQLKLVLAGKQIKDAVAGIKTAQPTPGGPPIGPTAASRYRSSYYGGDEDGYSGGSDVQHLAALYVKLEQYDKAEHLLLLGGGRDVEGGSLPMLASLMWRQQAKERALELKRLAVLQSSDTDQVMQFATMLAEAGQTQTAVDLLARAYRCLETQTREGGLYAMMFGYYDARNQGQGFESNEEESYASGLYDILQQAGSYDAVLSSLRDQARQQPEDSRLAKLILSLLIRDRRWEQARDSLVDWRKARPHEPGVLLEQFHVDVQLGEWEAALAVLSDLRQEVPEATARWGMSEAFVRLMQGDKAAAVAAVEPLLEAPQTENAGESPYHICTVLAVARDHDRLGQYLDKQRELGLLDGNARILALGLHQADNQWDGAVRDALDDVWRDPEGLQATHQAYRAFVSSVQAAKAGDLKVESDSDRPEDRALIVLAADGPAAGKKAFEKLLTEQPENINARRGLVFAAGLDHDDAMAVEANQQLITLLTLRRRDVWQAPPPCPLAERAKSFLAGLKTGGLNTQAVLGLSLSFGSMLSQMLDSGGSSENDRTVLYDGLWLRQQRLHGELLARSGRLDEFEALLKEQAAYAESQDRSGQSDRSYRSSRRGYSSSLSSSFYYGDRWSDREERFSRDWRSARRQGLLQNRLFEPLAKDYESLGSRIPTDHWPHLCETYAALGRDAEARQWLRKAAELQLAGLRAGDAPQIESRDSWYGWGWGRYGRSGSEDVERLRRGLDSGLYRRDDDPAEPHSPFSGTPDELWEFALLDPEIESQFLQLAAVTGPGWGDSQTVRQLLAYFDAKHQPQEVIAILERTFEPDALLRSDRLSQYLQACYETKDETRVERVLEKAAGRTLTLENDVLLARLLLRWDCGKDAEAEQLERQLVDRCRRERDNPNRPDKRLLAVLTASSSRLNYYRRLPSRFSYNDRGPDEYMSPSQMAALADMPALANALGVRCEGSVSAHDLTLNRIRSSFASHGQYKHALRILEMELSRDEPAIDPRQRMGLLQQKAEWLARSGDQPAAKKLVGQIEAFWRQEAQECPADSTPFREITELYASEKIGPDYAKALEVLRAAKRLDPASDASGAEEARYLYEMGRFADAWAQYQSALSSGDQQQDSDILYRAGIAAAKAGQTEPAASLLRQALWRDPQHKLAAQAKELVP